ncbi:MAG: quinolone resistance protein [Chloroflexi bacterium RBG_13_50_10]|nr:MAG: quinolone resistance protein [Chloroflexi bacterium RBG_13_50_10]
MEKRTLVTLLLALFIALLGVGIIAPIIPVYAMDLGATGVTLGLMVAAFSISQGVLQPVVGNLSDRRGRKRFLVAGLSIYAVVGLTYTLATSVEHLILIRLFHGVGSTMIAPIAMAYVADLAPRRQEGKYMGMLNIALFAGFAGGPVLGGVFRDVIGVNSAFYAMSALTVASLGLILALLPPDRSSHKTRSNAGLLTTLKRILSNTRVLGILLPRIGTMIVMVPTLAFLPILMDRLMGATGIEIGIVVSARTIVNAGLQAPFGRIADRHNKVALILIGSLIISACVSVLPSATNFLQLVWLSGFMGVGEALVWPTLGALAVEEGHRYGQGSMMGVFNMAMSAGVLIGSLVAGSFMDLFGLEYVFYIVAIVLAVSAVAGGLLIARRDPTREEGLFTDSNDS